MEITCFCELFILLMEQILHHLGSKQKPANHGIKLLTSSGDRRISESSTVYYFQGGYDFMTSTTTKERVLRNVKELDAGEVSARWVILGEVGWEKFANVTAFKVGRWLCSFH